MRCPTQAISPNTAGGIKSATTSRLLPTMRKV
jgi:hypothetical protein